MTWILLVYLLPLGLLFLTAFWDTDSFTGLVQRSFTTENFADLLSEPTYLLVMARTVLVAAAVTVICALLGLPMGFFMARVASPRWRPVLVALVLTPLWASYLVKVYAWRTMLAPGGVWSRMCSASSASAVPAMAGSPSSSCLFICGCRT